MYYAGKSVSRAWKCQSNWGFGGNGLLKSHPPVLSLFPKSDHHSMLVVVSCETEREEGGWGNFCRVTPPPSDQRGWNQSKIFSVVWSTMGWVVLSLR